MSRIVGVHGIAQQYRGGPERSAQWLLDVRGGLEAAGFRSVADGLTASDLRVAFYGDLFRPEGTMSRDAPPYMISDLDSEELELLAIFYDEALVQEPGLKPPPGAMAGERPPSQVMLDVLLRSRTFSGIAQHLLIGDLKQVTEYLEDDALRQEVLSRLEREMTDEVQVVIGHSLGSVVAYEFCCQPTAPRTKLLITLGSPLGIPRLIFDRLRPTPNAGTGVWPQTVQSWVNVADRKDVVALRKKLAPNFGPGPGGVRIADRRVRNGDSPHEASRYLNSSQTGEALGAVLSS